MLDKKVDKSQKNILVWVLTWAGLLLAVLYSPLGSPDLYRPKQFYIANQGVNFNGGAIAEFSNRVDNTKKIEIKNNNKKYSGGSNNNSSENLITANNNNARSVKVVIHDSNTSTPNSSANFGRNNAASAISNNSRQVTNNSNVSSGMGGDLYSFSVRNSKNKTTNNLSPELNSLSTELDLLTNNTTTRQLDGTPLAGTTDPGGDPFGQPIPIGDGWIFLLCLAAMYGIWKFKVNRNLYLN